MNKVTELRTELKKVEDEVVAQSADNFSTAPLTDEEQQKVEEMRKDKRVVVIDEGPNGSIEIPVEDYLESLDRDIAVLKNNKIKLLSKKVEKTKDELMYEAKDQLISMSNSSDITIDEIDQIITDSFDAVKKFFGIQDIDSSIMSKLSKLSTDELLRIFPQEYVNIFSTNKNTKNKLKVKEDILTTFAYCLSIGPDMDKLNSEIEHRNKMISLMLKLNDVNIDFATVIQSEESLKELGKRVLYETNELNNKYRKYVKTPDAINNVYTQKKYVLEKLVVAYENFIGTLTDLDEIRQVAEEIENNKAMIDAYSRILDLENFKTAVTNITSSTKNGTISLRDLSSKAYVTFDNFRKLKEDIAIPGLTGKEKNVQEIYNNYLNYFKNLIPVYNAVIETAESKGDNDLKTITVEGDIFAKCIITVLGKITKGLTKKNNINSSCEIVITFDMICRLGTELFMLNKINEVLMPMYEMIK